MLSSVYFKPPDQFVKRIRDRINERLDLEEDEPVPAPTGQNQQQQSQGDEYVDSLGIKKSEYVKENAMDQ